MDQHSDGQRTHRAEAAIGAIARSQHGAYSRQQAIDVGFTRGMIDRRIATRRWEILDHSVYRQAGTPSSWYQRLVAACLAGPAVASHRSAGRLWELPGMEDDRIEVTALRHRRRRAQDVVWHESYHLTPKDITEVHGIAVTRPIRTFLDLGAVLDAERIEEVLNDGLRRNVLSVPAIWRRLEQLGPLRRGAGRIRTTLERHVPGQRPPESVLETRFLQLIRAAGLPEPVAQHEVRVAGKPVARIDVAYPDLKLAIELDGEAYHFGERRERRDRERENSLVALQWRVLRFDWKDVTERTDYVIATIRGARRASA